VMAAHHAEPERGCAQHAATLSAFAVRRAAAVLPHETLT
jgi:hypothetical protein